MTYLDNAATTFPKPKCVYKRLTKCLRQAGGNPGRSSHRLALMAAEEIYSTREALCKLLDFPAPERIVFTQNATHALNLSIRSLRPLPRHVIYSDREHNSVIRPIAALKTEGCEHSVFSTDGDILTAMEGAMRPETDLCILSLCSNVTGECFPLDVLRAFRKKHPSVRIILDGAQWLGHLPFSLADPPCDILCAPGHKALFGIQGSGFAAFVTNGDFYPSVFGGSGNDSESEQMPRLLPERMEAGTLATPAIATLGEGARYLNSIGMDTVAARIRFLTDGIYERLHTLKKMHPLCENGFGTVSFTAEGFSSAKVASFLDARGIAVRAGLHCAPLLHRARGTLEGGAVRISVSYLNETRDLDRLYRALSDFQKKYY